MKYDFDSYLLYKVEKYLEQPYKKLFQVLLVNR